MTRIDGLNPLVTGRTAAGQSSAPVDGDGASGGPNGAGAAGRQDVVDLSNRGRIVALAAWAVSDSGDVRAERIAALKAAIADGTYRSNAREIAARLLGNGFGAEG